MRKLCTIAHRYPIYILYIYNCTYSETQLRWVHTKGGSPGRDWALDDIYIGEQCPDMCHGRGQCIHGQCHCDTGYDGELVTL